MWKGTKQIKCGKPYDEFLDGTLTDYAVYIVHEVDGDDEQRLKDSEWGVKWFKINIIKYTMFRMDNKWWILVLS